METRKIPTAERELDTMLDVYRQLKNLSPRARQLALDWLSYIFAYEDEVPF
jgi:hypothetical protein